MNKRAFGLGRIAAARPDLAASWLRGHEEVRIPDTLGDLLADRMPRLRAWGGRRAARALPRSGGPGGDGGGQVARAGRPACQGGGACGGQADDLQGRVRGRPADDATRPLPQRLRENFEGDYQVGYNLAPPLCAKRGCAYGPAAEAPLRRGDGTRVRVLRAAAPAARHAAGCVRLCSASPHGAPAGGRLPASLVETVLASLTPNAGGGGRSGAAGARPGARLRCGERGFGESGGRGAAGIAGEVPRLLIVRMRCRDLHAESRRADRAARPASRLR